jgi:hypothetical protein
MKIIKSIYWFYYVSYYKFFKFWQSDYHAAENAKGLISLHFAFIWVGFIWRFFPEDMKKGNNFRLFGLLTVVPLIFLALKYLKSDYPNHEPRSFWRGVIVTLSMGVSFYIMTLISSGKIF